MRTPPGAEDAKEVFFVLNKEIRKNEHAIRKIVALSLLSAMSIVLGKYLAIPWGDIMRFSFESMPIFFAGFVFGPLEALAVAVVADLVGCLLVGYTINPLITLGSVILALVGALVYRLSRTLPAPVRTGLSVMLGHTAGSVIVKTIGLAAYMGIGLWELMAWRLFNYTIVAILDGVVVFILLKSPVPDLATGKKRVKRVEKAKEEDTPLTYESALEYIHSANRPFFKPGLERVNSLLDIFGHPEADLAVIHIGGTNGKGSTSSMLASVLQSAGYRVGLYTSPFILDFNERIRVDGVNISNEDLVLYTEEIRRAAGKLSEAPTEFELITAIAFKYFKDKKCDYVVLEVGLGGRFDATNVVKSPLLSIITGISLDHTAILGDTVEKIAFEKAGIIKSGCPILFGGGALHAARATIFEEATKRKSPFYDVDPNALTIHERSLKGCIFDYKSLQNVKISLLGTYQPYNAITVIDAVEILRANGVFISDRDLYHGLERAEWMGRFEILSREDPLVIFDGAHNAEGISVAVQSIRTYFGDEKVYVLTGVLRDKDYTAIAETISTVAERAYTITPQNPRALEASTYATMLGYYGTKARVFADEDISIAFAFAYREAKRDRRPLIVLGSLYTYGDIYHALESIREEETKNEF